MSVPARRLVTPPQGTRVHPHPRGSEAPTRRRPSPARQPVRDRAPRPARHNLGFVLLSGALVGSMVFGIVVLNALLAQTSFRIGQAERQIQELSSEQKALVREQATLSAPGRIAAWARRHGMRLPDDIRILQAPGGRQADPAGAGTQLSASSGGSET